MKRLALCVAICLLTAFKGEDKKQACIKDFDGRSYVYSINPEHPRLTFHILFYCEGDSLRGAILGPVIQNNTNALYFRALVNSLQIKGDSISFNFIPGELYKYPFTLQNYNNYGGQVAVGFSQNRLFYAGVIKGDSVLDLECRNKYYQCPVDSIIFRRK